MHLCAHGSKSGGSSTVVAGWGRCYLEVVVWCGVVCIPEARSSAVAADVFTRSISLELAVARLECGQAAAGCGYVAAAGVCSCGTAPACVVCGCVAAKRQLCPACS